MPAATPAPAPDPSLMNFVIRMVVPMKREFGRQLDVQQFLRDDGYAQAVLDEALTSRDQRLRDYAEYVQRHLHGARRQAVAAPSQRPLMPPPAADTASAPPAAARIDASAAEPTEAELRARMLRKYTTGLR